MHRSFPRDSHSHTAEACAETARCLGDGIISGPVVPYKGSVIGEEKEEGGRRQIVERALGVELLGGGGPGCERRAAGSEDGRWRSRVNNAASSL